jgi:hypothetical protein
MLESYPYPILRKTTTLILRRMIKPETDWLVRVENSFWSICCYVSGSPSVDNQRKKCSARLLASVGAMDIGAWEDIFLKILDKLSSVCSTEGSSWTGKIVCFTTYQRRRWDLLPNSKWVLQLLFCQVSHCGFHYQASCLVARRS